MRKEVLFVALIWIVVAITILVLYILREVSPVKEFIDWAISVWPILAALGGIGILISGWVIRHDFSKEAKSISDGKVNQEQGIVTLISAKNKSKVTVDGFTSRSENLSGTLTQMHRRLVELQKEKASHTRVSIKQLEKASWVSLDKLRLLPLKDKPKTMNKIKRRVLRGLPRPPYKRLFRFKEWAFYRQMVRERGIVVGLEFQKELVSSRECWTLDDAVKASEWLDDYGWGIKELRDNDPSWNDKRESISDYLRDKTLNKLINKHLDLSYTYNNVCLLGHYSKRLGERASYLAELHAALVGSAISPEKAESALSEILREIEKYVSGQSNKVGNSNLSITYSPMDKYVRVHKCSRCGWGFKVLSTMLGQPTITCPKCGNVEENTHV